MGYKNLLIFCPHDVIPPCGHFFRNPQYLAESKRTGCDIYGILSTVCSSAEKNSPCFPDHPESIWVLGKRAEKFSASTHKFARFTIVKSKGILYNTFEYVNMGK